MELEKAMRGAASRRLAEGIETRDPIIDAQRLSERPAASRLLTIVAVLSALLLAGVTVSYLADIPPAHILIVALGIFWLFGWRIFKWRKRS
jgi:hypothetical protein